MRISTPYSNDFIKSAIACRNRVVNENMQREAASVNTSEVGYGEDVKMVHTINQRQIILTSSEKDEVVAKYEAGLNMTEVARLFGCHYTTVGRILRNKGVAIR